TGQALQHAEDGRHGLGGVGGVRDGREHAVEVEEEGGVRGAACGEPPPPGRTQRMRRTRRVSHGLQTTRFGGDFLYTKSSCVAGRRGADVCTTAYGIYPLAF